MEYKIGSKIRVRVCDNRIYTILDIDGDYVKIKEGLSVHKCHIVPLIDEEKLDELARDWDDWDDNSDESQWYYTKTDLERAYKAGYIKAKEE